MPSQDELSRAQEALDSYRRLQGGAVVDGVRGPFLRGELTLKLMKQLPLDTQPDLAASANYWAPVQAYYAAHGYGLAVLNALGARRSCDHRHFRSLLSDLGLGRLFPFPFNMLCAGDPLVKNECSVENCPVDLAEILSVSNLAMPSEKNAAPLVGRSLFATRKYFLRELFDRHRKEGKKRKGKSRKNLMQSDKRRLAKGLHATSFVDLLYRMRVRSNYDDPEMFIFGQTGEDVAVSHYRNLLDIVEGFALLCGNVISRKIGRADYEVLRATASR